MSEARRSTARETSSREDLVLERPDVEIIRHQEELEEDFAPWLAVDGQRLVWENRRFIFRVTVAGLLLSTLIAFLIPKRFQSTARLMPPDQGNSGMGMALLAASNRIGIDSSSGLGSMAGDLLGLKNSSDLFIGILLSRTVQDDVINKFDLKKVYSDRRMQDAREDLAERTSISSDRKSGIITVQVADNSPKRAAAIAGEYVSELNRVVTQLNTSSAHRERVFLEDRLTQVKQDLETAEKSFSEFASKNTALDIPAQGKAMIEAMGALEGQLVAAETELEGLKQVYADGNVRVRATEARVQELRRQLEQRLGSKPGGPATGNGRDREFPSIRELPALGVNYADLYRNTKIQEAVFQTLTQEYELAKVEEAKETPSVKVLDPPDVPEQKSFPPRLLIIALGAMLALAASMSWVFGKRAWDQTEQGDPQKAFAQEVIHTVRARLPWGASNGAGPNSVRGTVWGRFRRTKQYLNEDQ